LAITKIKEAAKKKNGKYLIMGSSTQAFVIASEQVQEKGNPLRTAEMTLEDDYGMIDGSSTTVVVVKK
jgi:hypothetical protein